MYQLKLWISRSFLTMFALYYIWTSKYNFYLTLKVLIFLFARSTLPLLILAELS